jgi:CheY-like chemotaxis protein
LAGWLAVGSQEKTAAMLRHILVDGIEALRPDASVPTQAKAWRYYHALRHHFVEQFTQREVARDFGISIRQLRRLEGDALQLLAAHLWQQHGLGELPARAEADTNQAEASATPSRLQEVEWSQQSFPSSRVALEELLAGTLRVMDSLFRSSHIRLEVALPENLPLLAVQPDIVRQVLLNILAATARAVPGGWMTISATAHCQEVTLRVLAKGLGAVHIPFAVEHDEGLMVTSRLLESTGGRLDSVKVERTGEFSIQVMLPAEATFTLLAVDDNPDTLQLLERYLATTGYHFVGIQDATKALDAAKSLLPDLIVLDVMLPNIDGWELLGQFCTHPTTSAIPVVVCTIMPQEQLALTMGASGFIRKPVGRLDFLAELEAQVRLLGRKQMDAGLDQPQ